jgi:hypothetical protein
MFGFCVEEKSFRRIKSLPTHGWSVLMAFVALNDDEIRSNDNRHLAAPAPQSAKFGFPAGRRTRIAIGPDAARHRVDSGLGSLRGGQ